LITNALGSLLRTLSGFGLKFEHALGHPLGRGHGQRGSGAAMI
jgi:hypothetical protein